MVESGSDGRDSLSTVSTILGLALFFIFVVVVLVRRLYLHRVNRMVRTRVLGPRLTVELDTDDHEPRTIAIGARAALLKRPILWEDHLLPLSDPKTAEVWANVQPTNLQLMTPHTTAHFPAKSMPSSQVQGPGRIRSYSHSRSYLVFHGTNVYTPSNALRTPTSPQRHSALAPMSSIDPTSIEPSSQDSKPQSCERIAHPVNVTFLISMPDPLSPSFPSTKPLSNPFSYSKTSLNAQIRPLELGTTCPIVKLNSMPISRAELDSWWNLPAISSTNRRQTGGMGRQSERERIRDILGFSFQNYP